MAEYGVGGGQNLFVPTFSPATGMIQVEFTRSPNRFGITRYAQLVPVSQSKGYYLRIDEEETVRIVNTQDLQWPLGSDRPTGINSDVEWTAFATKRYQDSFSIPTETGEQAQFDVVATHARIKATKLMTHRTYRALAALTTSGNWGSNTSATLDALGVTSGDWRGSSVANGFIQQSIQKVIENIVTASAGAVVASDIVMVIDPTVAHIISQAPETKDLIKYQAAANNFYAGDNQFATYGIPQKLFGLGGVVVEDAVRASNRKGATTSKAFMIGNKAIFLSRPGGLVGVEGPSFSTLTIFAYEDMTVETMSDSWNRRTRGSVVDNSDIVLTAPLSGWLLQDITT